MSIETSEKTFNKTKYILEKYDGRFCWLRIQNGITNLIIDSKTGYFKLLSVLNLSEYETMQLWRNGNYEIYNNIRLTYGVEPEVEVDQQRQLYSGTYVHPALFARAANCVTISRYVELMMLWDQAQALCHEEQLLFD